MNAQWLINESKIKLHNILGVMNTIFAYTLGPVIDFQYKIFLKHRQACENQKHVAIF